MNAKEVKKTLGVTQNTINNYIKKGILRFTAVNPYHYIYDDDDVYAILGKSPASNPRYNVTYSRVSLNKQKNDLVSQMKRLYDFSISSGLTIEKEISDIKSGMNFKDRNGLNKLIKDVVNRKVGVVVVENKDRLARFGFDLIEKIFGMFGTRIVVASNANNMSYDQELTQDLVSIIHYFSMKSYSNRRRLNKLKKELSEMAPEAEEEQSEDIN